MQKLISNFTLVLLALLSTYSVGSSQSYALDGSQIEVEVSINNEIIYIHKIQKDQTIYSLAKHFKISVRDLMFINDIEPDQIIALDSEIKIPLDPKKLQTPIRSLSDDWTPVVYKVKRGETLYSMSHTYFPQRMDHLIQRNNIFMHTFFKS